MQIIKVDNNKPDHKSIKKAADILKASGLVVYPTDTAYGLGVNALDKIAINKLYEVKERNYSKPTHVVVRDWKMINEITYPNENAKILYKKFLPGPLTLILPKRKSVPDLLTANLPTLGIRIPNNLITQSLSNSLPFPYTTPSANRTEGKIPYSVEDVKRELDTKHMKPHPARRLGVSFKILKERTRLRREASLRRIATPNRLVQGCSSPPRTAVRRQRLCWRHEHGGTRLDAVVIDLMLDAGKIPETLPSTLIDLSKHVPTILREGPITESQINSTINL